MTEEEFWGKCGFTVTSSGWWLRPKTKHLWGKNPPMPTLGNLFKFAWDIIIEKLLESDFNDLHSARVALTTWWLVEWENEPDPAIALRKAIEKVFEVE